MGKDCENDDRKNPFCRSAEQSPGRTVSRPVDPQTTARLSVEGDLLGFRVCGIHAKCPLVVQGPELGVLLSI